MASSRAGRPSGAELWSAWGGRSGQVTEWSFLVPPSKVARGLRGLLEPAAADAAVDEAGMR
ncbi:hypothetical protein OG698_00915 [Streptomyces sp. NBC_01003]|uniref:hypothetical protein n=1 Tax=Streptomyces sp. NBC_01003 TaxID=2903714 RepID=UPI0038673C05|nr:hypothetical protein OG698_00915 [Streptomyces sp. NBC_01003]